MTYAKLVSLGDAAPHGVTLTLEQQGGGRLIVLLDLAHMRYINVRSDELLKKMEEAPIV